MTPVSHFAPGGGCGGGVGGGGELRESLCQCLRWHPFILNLLKCLEMPHRARVPCGVSRTVEPQAPGLHTDATDSARGSQGLCTHLLLFHVLFPAATAGWKGKYSRHHLSLRFRWAAWFAQVRVSRECLRWEGRLCLWLQPPPATPAVCHHVPEKPP